MTDRPHVALFVTCLVDLFRPAVAFAAITLLERAGCRVSVPEAQTCCGQPPYNSGDREGAAAILRGLVATFEPYDAVVVPSGSCAGMIRQHAPLVLRDDPEWGPRAEALATRVFELTQYLARFGVDAAQGVTPPDCTVCYHDSCSSLRDMGVRDEPRRLLQASGVNVAEMAEPDECCGFGGLFAVKYPHISEAMADSRIANVTATGARVLTGADLGCLLHLAGRLRRKGEEVEVRHVAEILAGDLAAPAIGEGGK